MANTVEVVGGLGDATDSAVLSGVTYTSDNGIKRTGTFVPSADNIVFDNTNTSLESETVQDAIKEIVNNKSDIHHTHDDMYYTETETDEKLSALDSVYETKEDANTKFDEAKTYTDEQISTHVHSWDDLENKPFGVGLVNALVENWPDDWTPDRVAGTYTALHKDVSTDIQLEDFVVGDSYTLIIGNNYDVVEFVATDTKTLISSDRVDVNGNPTQITVTDHPTSSDKYRITYTGTELPITPAQAVKGPAMYHAVEGIIPIDEQYIPDTIARTEYVDARLLTKADAEHNHDDAYVAQEALDALNERIVQSDFEQNDGTAIDYVKNRTHWVQRAKVLLSSEIFECTTLASDSESYYCAKSGNIGLVDGNKYKVTVNGTTYTVPALLAFGTNDISLIADIETCRIYDRENGTVEVFSDSSSTLTISIEDAEDIYVKLDERFIPDGFARSEDVESKMDKENPAGFGSLSMNRASGSVIGENSVAIGTDCIASGASAIAVGSGASATGFSSYAEGSDTVASGDLAHAEGSSSKATGYASHAECSGEANGNYSHATGYSIADGDYSHASGNGTWAIGRSQTVIGEANIEDVAEDAATRGTYAVIVGNGDMDAGEFSNAATLDWNGTAWFAGAVKVGGTEQDDVDAKELATQEHVQEQLTAFEERILPRMTKINLPVSGWDTNALTQTVTVNGISADETSQLVTTRPIGDSISPAIEAGVYCKSQGENKLTFSCLIQPTYDIDYMVTWQNVVYILPTHTVTFYNDDGSVVLYVDKVNEGSDATYVGDIPTKDSDGVYDYSFIGWSLTIGGDIDESALVNVVSNRNVYAVFEKTEIEVVSGGWVPFCADNTTWTGEALGRVIAGSESRFGDHYREDVRLSPTNEYRMTIDGVEYLCSMNDNGEIGSSSMPAYTIKKVLSDDSIIYTVLTGTNLSRLNSFKLESWIPFTSEEPEIGEWVLYDTNGEKWVGETVDSDDCFSNTRIVISPTNQYRVTLDGVSQIVGNLNISNNDAVPFNGGEFYGEFGDTCVMFDDGGSHVFKVESWTGSEPYVPEEPEAPDEPETTGEWVPFCADGVTWMGEQVTEAKINTLPVVIADVVLSEANQYRLTVDGAEYICVRNEENYGASISCDGCPVIINYGESLGGWYFDDGDSDTRFSGTLKVESWTGSEPYAPEEVTYEWVPMAADGVSYMGESIEIPHENQVPAKFEYVVSDSDQYRATINGVEYLFSLGDEGLAIVGAEDTTVTGGLCFYVNGSDIEFGRYEGLKTVTTTLKLESYVAKTNVPEEEGYIPTDGYQAFTTDGTWTGEEVTTAASVSDFTKYTTSYLSADIQWNGAPSTTISNDTIVLIWVDNVCYTCNATVIGSPKSVYCFTCDECPAAVMGGLGVGNNNWKVAFTTAGTYKLKVEVKTA